MGKRLPSASFLITRIRDCGGKNEDDSRIAIDDSDIGLSDGATEG